MRRKVGKLLVQIGGFLIILSLLARWYGLNQASLIANTLGMAMSSILVLLGLIVIYRN